MTARVPRQRRAEDRREALIAAATRLAATQGPAACTARAVATAAGLPLASVSYYFADLSNLVAEAVRRVCTEWREHAQAVAARAGEAGPAGPAGPAGHSVPATDFDHERLTVVIAAAILPPAERGSASASASASASTSETRHPADEAVGAELPARAAVAARYRHLLAAADSPVVTVEIAALRTDLVAVVASLLPPDHTGIADLLVTVVDGAALGAIAEGDPDPARRAVAAVAAILDQLF